MRKRNKIVKGTKYDLLSCMERIVLGSVVRKIFVAYNNVLLGWSEGGPRRFIFLKMIIRAVLSVQRIEILCFEIVVRVNVSVKIMTI